MTKASIREVMTPNPVIVRDTDSVLEAARQMRDNDIGDVIVFKGGKLFGIATDRDIVVRAVAAEKDPKNTTVGAVCSREVVTLPVDATTEDAIRLMRERKLRRLPVSQSDQIIGIVSLGDLAIHRDRQSVLGEVSSAPPNR